MDIDIIRMLGSIVHAHSPAALQIWREDEDEKSIYCRFRECPPRQAKCLNEPINIYADFDSIIDFPCGHSTLIEVPCSYPIVCVHHPEESWTESDIAASFCIFRSIAILCVMLCYFLKYDDYCR